MKIYLIDDDDCEELEQCVHDLTNAENSFSFKSSIDSDYEIMSIQNRIDTIIDTKDCACDVKLANTCTNTDSFIAHGNYVLVYSTELEVLIDILCRHNIHNDLDDMIEAFGSVCHAFIIKS